MNGREPGARERRDQRGSAFHTNSSWTSVGMARKIQTYVQREARTTTPAVVPRRSATSNPMPSPSANDTIVSAIVIAAPWASEVDVSDGQEDRRVEAHRCLPGECGKAPTERPAPCDGRADDYLTTSSVGWVDVVRLGDRRERAVVLECLERRGQRVAELRVALRVVDAVVSRPAAGRTRSRTGRGWRTSS